jgi:hypothetical protein
VDVAAPVSEKPQIKVIISEDHIAVLEPVIELLEPLFSYRRRTFVPGGPMGYKEVEETVSLCDVDIKGRMCFAAGLMPRVRRLLREQGYRVRVDDLRKSGTRLSVDMDVIADCASKEKQLLQAVVREPLGQIEVSTDKDTLVKMLLVTQVFPDAQVVVSVATPKEAWR